MNKILILVFFLLASCSKKNELENIFTCDKNEYWSYKNNCGSYGIYFKFNSDGSHDKYLSKPIDEGKGFDLFNNDGDVISGPRTWSIKNDSIFVWDKGVYKIESYNENIIILTYYHYKEKNKKCSVALKKVLDK
jgi:hypothetical protein